MAVRISHSARRSSTSRWRRTLTFTIGTAAPIRISRIVITTIISSRVTPRCRAANTRLFQKPRFVSPVLLNIILDLPLLVYGNRGLRAQHIQRLVLAVARAWHGDGNGPRSLGLRRKHQAEHSAVAGNTRGPRGTLR